MSRRSRFFLLVYLLIGLGVAACWLWWPRASHSPALQQAREAIARRDLPQAISLLDQHLADWPDDPEGHLLMAQCARRADLYSEAEEHLKRYLQLEGDAQMVRVERSMAENQRGEKVSLAAVLEIAQKFPDEPATPLAMEATARGLMQTGQWFKAQQCLERWLDLKPSQADRVQILIWRGESRSNLGMADQARDDFRAAHELDPESADAHYHLADMLVRLDPQEALRHFEAAARKQPDRLEIRLGLARALRNLGDFRQAGAILEELRERWPAEVRVWTESARLELDRRRPAEAEKHARKGEAVAPKNHDLNVTLLRCLREQEGKEAAADAVDARLKKIEEELNRRIAEFTGSGKGPQGPEKPQP